MSEKKRLLVLGGSPFQVPLIEKAKGLGLHVITCDYLPDNPGHALADEYHNVSTTDKEAVLEVGRRYARSMRLPPYAELGSTGITEKIH